MKDSIRDALSVHYFHLLKLGTYYSYLAQIASVEGADNISEYIKYLSNDKIGVHKDKIAQYLQEIGVSLNHNVKTLDDIKYADFDEKDRVADIKRIVTIVRDLEVDDEKRVNETASLIFDARDHATYAFFTWYTVDALKDLHEIQSILDDFDLSNDLLVIDRKVKKINKANRKAEKLEEKMQEYKK